MRSKYDKSLNGVGLSLFKFCGFDINSGNLRNIDRVLKEEDYDNIIVLMYSGLSSNILDLYEDECSYLRSHQLMEITSVWPSTSVSTLTSLVSGKTPIEHKVFGTNNCISFKNNDYSNIINEKFINKINLNSNVKAYGVLPFGIGSYDKVDEGFERILSISKNTGKKIIFGYFNDLAQTISKNGLDSNLVKNKLNKLTSNLKDLLEKLENSLVLVLSDCGYSNCSDIMMNKYPSVLNLIDKVIVNDNRFCSVKLKSSFNEFKEEFMNKFNFDFDLYSKEEVIKKGLFGEVSSKKVELDFDCVIIGKRDKRLNFGEKSNSVKSSNAGLTNKEVLLPVIVLKKKISREFIRQVVIGDFTEVRKMYTKIQTQRALERGDIFIKYSGLSSFEFSDYCSRGSSAICFVYVKNEQILGFITLKHGNNISGKFTSEYNYLSVEQLYVIEEYRRQGIATKLYEEALKFAKKRHIKKITVKIWEFDKELDLFFQSLANNELYKVLELDV